MQGKCLDFHAISPWPFLCDFCYGVPQSQLEWMKQMEFEVGPGPEASRSLRSMRGMQILKLLKAKH